MNFDASRMLAFDLETTSANPKEARIVTSALVRIDGRDVQKVEHLADPGIEIPQEATNVHGITTEKARAEGRPHEEVLKDTVEAIKAAWAPPPYEGEQRKLDVYSASKRDQYSIQHHSPR